MHNPLLVLVFFLPAAAATGIPVLAALIPGLRKLDAPMDFGLHVRGRPLLGKNKTWRGFLAGVIAATLLLWLQQQLALRWHPLFSLMDKINYTHLNTLLLGSLLGAGAMIGDAVESFVKRQIDYPPGKSWFPFDQLDFVIGAIVFTLPYVALSVSQYIWTFVVLMAVHVSVDRIGAIFHLKDRIN